MSTSSRRVFLKQAGAAAGLGAVCSLTGSTPVAAAPDEDAPVRMKYAMCNESFEDWPQDRVFQFIGRCGYAAVEIAPFTIEKYVTEVSAERRKTLRRQADAAGIEIVALHWLLAKTEGLHLTSPDAAVREKTTQYLVELARFCKDLGGSIMVFGSPKQRNLMPGVSREEGLKFATEVLRGAMPKLAKLGVVLALEPLSPGATNFMRTAAEAVELAEMVDSPNCRLLLDCKAMVTEPTPIPDLIRKYASWLVHFHVNDPNLRGPGMGEMDFLPVFQALHDIRFDGWVSVEVFDFAPGPEALARESIQYMKRIESQLAGR
jgi:sugar phosphate isomerase/epimerase